MTQTIIVRVISDDWHRYFKNDVLLQRKIDKLTKKTPTVKAIFFFCGNTANNFAVFKNNLTWKRDVAPIVRTVEESKHYQSKYSNIFR